MIRRSAAPVLRDRSKSREYGYDSRSRDWPGPTEANPLTSYEIEYTPEQVEFGRAMERFKRFSGRYPTWADVLKVAKSLGYVRRNEGG